MAHEEITVYTLGWHGDEPIRDGDERTPVANLHCRVFIDGKELICAISAGVLYSADFARVTIEATPSAFNVVRCTREEWDALPKPGASA